MKITEERRKKIKWSHQIPTDASSTLILVSTINQNDMWVRCIGGEDLWFYVMKMSMSFEWGDVWGRQKLLNKLQNAAFHLSTRLWDKHGDIVKQISKLQYAQHLDKFNRNYTATHHSNFQSTKISLTSDWKCSTSALKSWKIVLFVFQRGNLMYSTRVRWWLFVTSEKSITFHAYFFFSFQVNMNEHRKQTLLLAPPLLSLIQLQQVVIYYINKFLTFKIYVDVYCGAFQFFRIEHHSYVFLVGLLNLLSR